VCHHGRHSQGPTGFQLVGDLVKVREVPPVYALDVHVQDAPAGKSHLERTLVRNAVPAEHRHARSDHVPRELEDFSLDATAGYRPNRTAVRAYEHRSARQIRRGAERRDNRAHADRLTATPPVQQRG